MSDALKVINNIRTLRAQARELTLDTLEEMLEKLTIVVEERREEEASFLKQQEEKQWLVRRDSMWLLCYTLVHRGSPYCAMPP